MRYFYFYLVDFLKGINHQSHRSVEINIVIFSADNIDSENLFCCRRCKAKSKPRLSSFIRCEDNIFYDFRSTAKGDAGK